MTLNAGTRLGCYEVSEPIGAGGMGEVYRARDTKLNRDVALKVLPEAFVRDPERLARFQREAEVLASLNHPNIAQIYGLEDSGDTTALVLELVEGETLAERIARGPIPLDEALAIAKQITEALEAAHERGIIHRDLKPANIKVTPEGIVKVLDFGLAKALEGPSGGDASESPTMATAVTGMGVIMGTAAYMSPEQAHGKPVDRRADIWAFGVVMYEMLTGKRAFEAEDVSLTLAEVMKSEPSWNELPDDLSPTLRTYLERCLRKDPKERVRDIGDVRLAMGGAFETEAATHALAPATADVPLWKRWLPALLVVAAGVALWALTRPSTSPPKVSRTSIFLPQSQLRTDTGRRGIAVSPDGTHIAYTANRQLNLRAIDELEAEPLGSTEDSAPTVPMFSPDGEWVGFYSTRDHQLKKVAITGGTAVTLFEGENPSGAHWGSDNAIVFASGARGIFRVPADGGSAELLVSPAASGEWFASAQILPDGETVLFTVWWGGKADVFVQSLGTGERRMLIEDGYDARYLLTGHLMFAVAGNILVAPFDADRLEIVGGPVPVVEGVSRASRTWGNDVDVSRDGMLVYIPASTGPNRVLVWVDRDGRVDEIPAEPRAYDMVRISPDGSKAVVSALDGQADLWLWDFNRETLTRMTFDPGLDENAEWLPDGSSVVFASNRHGRMSVNRTAVDGTGGVERVLEGATTQWPFTVTRDGSGVVLVELDASTRTFDLAVLALEGEPVVRPLVETDFNVDGPHLAPDDRWIAYHSDESGKNEIYVRPFPDVDAGRWQISNNGGAYPLWGPDGRELFWRTAEGHLMRVTIETDPDFAPGTPEILFEPGTFAINPFDRSFDISPDGERFLMMKEAGRSAEDDPYAGLTQIVVVQNWFEELNARVPIE